MRRASDGRRRRGLAAPRRRGADGELGEADRRPAGHRQHVVVDDTEHPGAERVDVELAVMLGGLRWRASGEKGIADRRAVCLDVGDVTAGYPRNVLSNI